MFFLASKILSFLLTPIVWITALILRALFSKDVAKRKKRLLWSFVIFYLFSNSFILSEVTRRWEIPARTDQSLGKYEVGIVLGGFSNYDPTIDRIDFYRGSGRLWHAIRLYNKGIIKKIMISGGSGRLVARDIREAAFLHQFLLDLGIPDRDILLESESKNTRENAVNTEIILSEKKIKGELLLITSALHMRRAAGCFAAAGLEVDLYTVNRISGPRVYYLEHLIVPSAYTLSWWNDVLHEIFGYLVYKLLGYA